MAMLAGAELRKDLLQNSSDGWGCHLMNTF